MMNNFKRYMICFILTMTCSACFAMNGPAVPPVTSSGGSPFATENYVANAIGADLIFWGSASTSADLAGYNRLDSATFYPQVTQVIANVSAVESQLGKFVTNLGSPDIDEIAPGLAWVHIYAVSDGATIKFRPTLWKISAGGVVTQLATATRYRNLNTSGDIISSEMDIAVAIPLEKTDRIFTALYGYAVDGSAPDLTVYLGGVNGTHIHLPVTSNVNARLNGNSAEDFAAKDILAEKIQSPSGNSYPYAILPISTDSSASADTILVRFTLGNYGAATINLRMSGFISGVGAYSFNQQFAVTRATGASTVVTDTAFTGGTDMTSLFTCEAISNTEIVIYAKQNANTFTVEGHAIISGFVLYNPTTP